MICRSTGRIDKAWHFEIANDIKRGMSEQRVSAGCSWPHRSEPAASDGHKGIGIAGRSPWQDGCAERLIGSVRRDASTMSSSLASGTFVICSRQIKILQRDPHASIAGEGRPTHAPFRLAARRWLCLLGGQPPQYAECKFPTGTGFSVHTGLNHQYFRT